LLAKKQPAVVFGGIYSNCGNQVIVALEVYLGNAFF